MLLETYFCITQITITRTLAFNIFDRGLHLPQIIPSL